jgi:hypothetical protein
MYIYSVLFGRIYIAPNPCLNTGRQFEIPTLVAREGLCPVTKLRDQAETIESILYTLVSSCFLYMLSVSYPAGIRPEQHGTGLEKIIFVMGLNSTSFSWS